MHGFDSSGRQPHRPIIRGDDGPGKGEGSAAHPGCPAVTTVRSPSDAAAPGKPAGRRRGPSPVTLYALAMAILPAALFLALARLQVPRVPWAGAAMLPCYLLAAMLVIGELRPLLVARADGDTDQVTVSTTFSLALVLAGPLAFVMLVQGLAVATSDVWSRRRPLRAAFNVGSTCSRW